MTSGFYPSSSSTGSKPNPGCAECKRLTDGIREATSTPFGWKARGILLALLHPPKESK